MLTTKHLPQQLMNFLCDDQMFKGQLEAACDLPQNSFVGSLKLGAFEKEHFLISSSTISLANLTAQILSQYLPKNIAEQISSN